MEGTKPVRVCVGGREMVHEVWLGHMQDPCIAGLDLLGAQVDVPRARLPTPAWGEELGGTPARVCGGAAPRQTCSLPTLCPSFGWG